MAGERPGQSQALDPHDFSQAENVAEAMQAAFDVDKWAKYSKVDKHVGLLDILMGNRDAGARVADSERLRQDILRPMVQFGIAQSQQPFVKDVQDQYGTGFIRPTDSQMRVGAEQELAPSNLGGLLRASNPPVDPSVQLSPEPPGGLPRPDGPFGLPPVGGQAMGQQAGTPLSPQYLPAVTHRPMELDPNARLNPVQAGALHAYQQQQSLRPHTPAQQAVGVQEFNATRDALLDAFAYEHQRPPNPIEYAQVIKEAGRYNLPNATPGSPNQRTAEATATSKEAEAKRADERVNAEVQSLMARTEESKAGTETVKRTLQGKLDETTARIALLKKQASTIGQKAELADLTAGYERARSAFAVFVKTSDTETLDRGVRNLLLSIILKNVTGADTVPPPPGTWDRLFGETVGMGATLPSAVPPPSGSPPEPRESPTQPQLPKAEVPHPDALEELRKLQKTMKEGEVATHNGKRYTIYQGQLGTVD